ncbi:hypothetical protein [Paenibacillus sp. NPDC055715]
MQPKAAVRAGGADVRLELYMHGGLLAWVDYGLTGSTYTVLIQKADPESSAKDDFRVSLTYF